MTPDIIISEGGKTLATVKVQNETLEQVAKDLGIIDDSFYQRAEKQEPLSKEMTIRRETSRIAQAFEDTHKVLSKP